MGGRRFRLVGWMVALLLTGCGQDQPSATQAPTTGKRTTPFLRWRQPCPQSSLTAVLIGDNLVSGHGLLDRLPSPTPFATRDWPNSPTIAAQLHRPAIEAKLREREGMGLSKQPPVVATFKLNRVWFSPKGTGVLYFDGTASYVTPRFLSFPLQGCYWPETGKIRVTAAARHPGGY